MERSKEATKASEDSQMRGKTETHPPNTLQNRNLFAQTSRAHWVQGLRRKAKSQYERSHRKQGTH